jgi:hypothetical protein
MLGGPAEGDDAAPVVTEGDDGTGQAECVGEGCEVGDPLFERAGDLGPLGPAHLELVDGDDAPGGPAGVGLLDGPGDERAPEVRPGRVAVNGEDGADRFDAGVAERLGGVEVVPVPRHAVVGQATGDVDAVRVPRGEAGQTGGAHAHRPQADVRGDRARYHASSMRPVFNPEPTPMRRTRSPLFRVDCWSARVIGMDAGPTLPR